MITVLDAVLFDLDGTLADTMPNLVFCVNHMRARFDLPPVDTETVTSLVGVGERDFVRGALTEEAVAARGESFFEEAYAFYESFYAEHGSDLVVPYGGMTAVLDQLRRRELRLGIVTNKVQIFAERMAETLFPGRFCAIVGVGQYPPKPDPAPAVAAARMLGVTPARCAFVGDSEFDMMTAKNAGMIAIGAGWGYRPAMLLTQNGASAVAEQPADLTDLIGLCEKGLLL